jgi:hypothetical protein
MLNVTVISAMRPRGSLPFERVATRPSADRLTKVPPTNTAEITMLAGCSHSALVATPAASTMQAAA